MNINPFSEPIDHVLKRLGVCSDRAFKNFIKTHRVEIKSGGSLIKISERSERIDTDNDLIFIDGKLIEISSHLYILLNKPKGIVSSRVSDSHKTVFSILPNSIKTHKNFSALHIAGRLDEESRGLVFLTTNGSLSDYFMNSKTHVEKDYKVTLEKQVSKELQKEYITAVNKGMELPPQKKGPGFKTRPSSLLFYSETECLVTLSEGKFHQVRRMFSVLGNKVSDLQRTRLGPLTLPQNLKEGECVILERSQIIL